MYYNNEEALAQCEEDRANERTNIDTDYEEERNNIEDELELRACEEWKDQQKVLK